MARSKISVKKINEIQRLIGLGLTERAIARALSCSRNTVKKYRGDTSNKVVATTSDGPDWSSRVDWEEINKEYQLGVSLKVLWQEKHEAGVVPVTYANFWKQFIKLFPKSNPTMVRVFKPGSRIEIDYCDGIDILDPATGEILKTNLFVGVLCHSRYTFAEFTFTQKSEDFLNSHIKMFNFFGGVPQTLAPDNLKSAVTKAHRYDPDINPAYQNLAEYYRIAVTPARVRRPKDKPIVERTIQIFQKWFFAIVRKRTFTSIVELNQCLREHLKIFNEKEHRIFKKTRSDMFTEERKCLMSLPDMPYEIRTHKKAQLYNDCHFYFDGNYYSAPWQLRNKQLSIWATEKTIEVFHEYSCIAIHKRSRGHGRFVTNKDHYPPQHKAYLEITPSYLKNKAKEISEEMFQLIDYLMGHQHPLRYLRRAQGILALSKKHPQDKLNFACDMALKVRKTHIPFIESIIKNYRPPGLKPELKIIRGNNPHLRGNQLFN